MYDAAERERALDPEKSFIVQAPAGSGKTELLTQRFLVLLATVRSPEEMLAITFTKKSAKEMRSRVMNALINAAAKKMPESDHAKITLRLAENVLQQDEKHAWHLLSNPNRLRIQTIDSFHSHLSKQLPLSSLTGASFEIAEDPTPLYQTAVYTFLSHLEENVAWADAIAQLLTHLDNDLNHVATLLIHMLAKRDQWLPYITMNAQDPNLRDTLEKHLTSVIHDIVTEAYLTFPRELEQELLEIIRFALPSYQQLSTLNDNVDLWINIADLLLTNDFNWRKQFNKNHGFLPEKDALMKQRALDLIAALYEYEPFRVALAELKQLPAARYEEDQWKTLFALHDVLRFASAQLKLVFQETGKIDYIENAQAALFALGQEDAPTDLALALDYHIRHILIDEFQDTSISQYRLLERLIAGWQPNDGHTLFVVGDPMQSIYRFREAEVGLFIRTRKNNIGNINLVPLTLSVNFRSTRTIVEWINHHFENIFPKQDHIAKGAVTFSPSTAIKQHPSTVSIHSFVNARHDAQAKAIVKLIRQLKMQDAKKSIAILVRSRTHLKYIIPTLKAENIPFQAIQIDSLASKPLIQDLMGLTRAMLHLADRIAWLSILRAPWCGLTLADLLVIAGKKETVTLFEKLKQDTIFSALSDDGKIRLARILPVLNRQLAERRRSSLSHWIRETWTQLGGPACVDQLSDLNDAAAFFELLEKLDDGGDIIDLDELNKQTEKLYANPQNAADDSLQIMTIHNAKGLEFDTVILPHLERKASSDKKQLLQWMEKPRENATASFIIAPLAAAGEKSNTIYDYIKRQHAIKTQYELARLLYVSVTRARENLHLFFSKDEELNKTWSPPATSFLEKLWPTIHTECTLATPLHETVIAEKKSRTIKRLMTDWAHPFTVEHHSAVHQKISGFLLPATQPKIIGIVVHQLLQQLSVHGTQWWTNHSSALHEKYIYHYLMQLGMQKSLMPDSIQRICQAINNTISDPRGQWILHPHKEAAAEWALSAVMDDEIKHIVIDRTFVDDTETRWIIDYKTTDFPLEEHHLQLLQYAEAMKKIESRPIRLGLYFPLTSVWKELP